MKIKTYKQANGQTAYSVQGLNALQIVELKNKLHASGISFSDHSQYNYFSGKFTGYLLGA